MANRPPGTARTSSGITGTRPKAETNRVPTGTTGPLCGCPLGHHEDTCGLDAFIAERKAASAAFDAKVERRREEDRLRRYWLGALIDGAA